VAVMASERCLSRVHVECVPVCGKFQDRFRGVADEDMMITAVFVERDASRYARVAFNFLFESLSRTLKS
jgi:hypothetical protein